MILAALWIQCAVNFSVQTASAQPRVVSPSVFSDIEAPDVANVANFPSYRLQQVYDASEFASLGPGTHVISRIDWRADGPVADPLLYSSPDWRLSFSTTSVEPGNLSVTFAENVGPDEQVVISGPVTLQTNAEGPAGGPKLFDYGVDFAVRFPYDPSQGNLLMDLTVRASAPNFALRFTVFTSMSLVA